MVGPLEELGPKESSQVCPLVIREQETLLLAASAGSGRKETSEGNRRDGAAWLFRQSGQRKPF